MKKTITFLVITLCLFSAPIHSKPPAFTHNLTAGRWGDQIIAYAQLLYLAHKHNVAIYPRKHPVFDHFKFSTTATFLTDDIAETYGEHIKITNTSQLSTPQSDTLYELWYKIIDNSTPQEIKAGDFAKMVWGDPEFHALLKDKLQCISPLEKPDLPNDKTTIAVHIRKPSGGKDIPLYSEQIYSVEPKDTSPKRESIITEERYSDTNDHVFKFVPEQYYIDQLQLVADSLDGPLHVRLFTDSEDPHALAERIEKAVNKSNVTVTYRRDNGTTERACDIDAIVQDWYDMTQYDILLRSESNFPKTAQLVSESIVAIYPTSTHWKGKKLIVDESCALIKNTEKPYVDTYSLPAQTDEFKAKLRSAISVLHNKKRDLSDLHS